jgi:hypothetical protein
VTPEKYAGTPPPMASTLREERLKHAAQQNMKKYVQ